MPVVHLTVHAFGTWMEDHPKGYVQRGEGLKASNPGLSRARRGLQAQDAVNFDDEQRRVVEATGWDTLEQQRKCVVYGSAVTRTHGHFVFAFDEPRCDCGARERAIRSPGNGSGASGSGASGGGKVFCRKGCAGRGFAEDSARRLKKDVGMALAAVSGVVGRKWLSRGWDLTPVWGRGHLVYLLEEYLPKHVAEGGLVRIVER